MTNLIEINDYNFTGPQAEQIEVDYYYGEELKEHTLEYSALIAHVIEEELNTCTRWVGREEDGTREQEDKVVCPYNWTIDNMGTAIESFITNLHKNN